MPSHETITSATLRDLAAGWVVELAQRPPWCPSWLAEHLGQLPDGRRWASEAAYQWLPEAGRANLTPRQVQVTRGGKTYATTVYVSAGKPAAGGGHAEVTAHAPARATLADGRRVSFVPHPNQRPDETTILVDPKRVEADWSKVKDEHIPPGGGGAEIPGRRANFEAFLKKGQPVQASRFNLAPDGSPSFFDGRHRFSVLRDAGASAVAVTVPRGQAAEIARRYGHHSAAAESAGGRFMDLSFVAERLVMPAAGGHVDSDRGIVYNVRVVGPKSRNGRKYPGPVTARYAHLFEGSGVNIGHHFDPRTGLPTEVPPADRFGRLANVRPHADGLNADLKFNAAHAFAAPFVWACRHNPALYSLSVLQRVRWKLAQGGRVYRDDDGDTVAEAILEVASVDVVADGGTNETVFESFNAAWRAMLPPPEPPPSAGAMRIRQQVEALVVGEPQSLPVAPRRPMTVQEIVAGYDPNAI